jgi:hypothetical protein
MGSKGVNMIDKSIKGKLYATTNREWWFRQVWYFFTDTSDKGGL